MFGILESIEENRSQRGETYWSLTISGRRYTVWNEQLTKDLQPGNQLQFSFQQSGQYRKIVELQKISTQNRSLNPWLHQQDERTRRIARMSCLKTAAQIVEGTRLSNMKRAELVLQIARLFEKHILDDQVKSSLDEKVTT